jgi:phage FluMu protein Com
MGHYCRICGKVRANEAFSAYGHERHVCRRCKRLAAESDTDKEVRDFLEQSHISPKNTERLREIAASANPKRAEWAAAILEVALVAPHKRHRLGRLAREHPDLLAKLVQSGLVEAEPLDELSVPPPEDFADPRTF